MKAHGIIITPASIRPTIYEDVVRIFQEGIFTAWEHLLAANRTQALARPWKRLREADISNPQDPETVLGLMMLGSLTEKEIEERLNIYKNIKSKITHPSFLDEMYKIALGRLESMKKTYELNPDKLAAVSQMRDRLNSFIGLSPILKLKLIGECLAFNPDRTPVHGTLDPKGLEALDNFCLRRIKFCLLPADFKRSVGIKEPHIIIRSYENLQSMKDKDFPRARACAG